MNSFSVNELYKKAFGKGRGKPFDEGQIIENDLAKPVFDGVIKQGSDTATAFEVARTSIRTKLNNGVELYMPVAIDGVVMPNEPTLSFYFPKKVVMTELAGNDDGRRGTVKEMMGFGDVQITMKGIIVNEDNPHEYPENEVSELFNLFLKNSSLKIECGLTSLFDIYRVVVLDLNLPEAPGSVSVQPYEIKLVSDTDFDLEIV